MVGGQQARRGAELLTMLKAHARPTIADGYARREHALELSVSPPLPHGIEATTLGYVVALAIVDRVERERFVFASDVQGPLSAVAAAWLIHQRPTLVYLAGPPSYIEREVGTAVIERGIDNLLRVIDATGCRVIMDHHAVREAAFAAKDLDGALGRWSVDANGDTTYAAEQLYVVRGLPGGATAWLWDSEITP
jgi:predicted metallo-beta-lactamase superfamily hydrolase